MLGPTTNTNSINSPASAMLRMDRRLTPLSSPAATESAVSAVMMAMVMTCTVVPTGTLGHR